MGSYEVVLSVADNPTSTGICSADNSIISHIYSRRICETAADYIRSKNHSATIIYTGSVRDKVKAIKAIAPICSIEPHINTSTRAADSGHMVLYGPRRIHSSDLASCISKCLKAGLKQFKAFGPQPVPGRMSPVKRLSYLSDTGCTSVITKTLYVSNTKDLEWLKSDMSAETLGMLIADGICTWMNSF